MRKTITFENAQGTQLSAKLENPPYEPAAYAVFAHCFTCTKDSLAAVKISQALTKHGIAVLRFDFTGIGESEGDFQSSTFSRNISDIVSASEFLRKNYRAPSLLIGHSLGGTAVLAAADQIKEVKAVATIGAPSDPEHVTDLFKQEEITNVSRNSLDVSKQFIMDFKSQNVLDKMSSFEKALLILHSPVDEIVSIDHAKKIYQASKHPKSFISLDNAKHLLTKQDDANYVADIISSWSTRYIDFKKPSSPKNKVEVAENHYSKYSQTILSGEHILFGDEPIDEGGLDLGPSPYDYVLAALGTCTSMTLRMYAERKDIPLDDVNVTLKHKKIHAEDCKDCHTKEGKIDQIERNIHLVGNLTDEQKQKLLEIADKCPVHRTLNQEVVIETQESR